MFRTILSAHPAGIDGIADEVLAEAAVSAGAPEADAPRIIRLLRASMSLATSEADTDQAEEAAAAAPAPVPTPSGIGGGESRVTDPAAAHIAASRNLSDHPLILALLGEAPVPGSPWKDAARADWIKAFDAVLTVIYGAGRI